MLCDQLSVGLKCGVFQPGAPGRAVRGKEAVMVHAGLPQVLTGLGAGQKQRHLTVLGFSLQHAQFRL